MRENLRSKQTNQKDKKNYNNKSIEKRSERK